MKTFCKKTTILKNKKANNFYCWLFAFHLLLITPGETSFDRSGTVLFHWINTVFNYKSKYGSWLSNNLP